MCDNIAMKLLKIAALMAVVLSTSGCSKMFWPFSELSSSSGGRDAQPERVVEPTLKFSIALGGVYPGRDELVIYDAAGNERTFAEGTFECNVGSDMITLEPRPDFSSVAAGGGAKIVPQKAGVTSIECFENGSNVGGIYEVTVPPQELVQILIAEAGQQIISEATLDESVEDSVVTLASESPTASALGAVIRNRINMMNDEDDTSLFEVDQETYDSATPASYYTATILATGQFSPTDPASDANAAYVSAASRSTIDEDLLVAYDQSVLTAAQIFNGDISDPTGNAFGFRTPDPDEWTAIQNAFNARAEIPAESGFTDATFPALAPIQLLILNSVATFDDARPTFIFARERPDSAVAITDVP